MGAAGRILRPLRAFVNGLGALEPLGVRFHECPVCGYRGRFVPRRAPGGTRPHAECPRCGALERHRLQLLAVQKVLDGASACSLRVLHVAPEPFFAARFRETFAEVVSVDPEMAGVDRREDLTRLSFPDASFDLVFASHVLEHVPDDAAALSQIRRVLRPGGIAFLPVPLYAGRTMERGAPDPADSGHVRRPGEDYYERYRTYFSRVDLLTSRDFDERYQPYVYYPVRAGWPPERLFAYTDPSKKRHLDAVPVCYK